MDGKAIKTPICTTEIDFDSIKIMCNGRKYIKCNYQPHYGEHSAENEIPFVQRTFPNAKIVVILVGTHNQMFSRKSLMDWAMFLSKKKFML